MMRSILYWALFGLLFTACSPNAPKTSSPELQTATLQFIDFSSGDGPSLSYNFKDSNGLPVSFRCNDDPKISFYKGKWLKITYTPREGIVSCDGERGIVDCIVKAELIADSIKTDFPTP